MGDELRQDRGGGAKGGVIQRLEILADCAWGILRIDGRNVPFGLCA